MRFGENVMASNTSEAIPPSLCCVEEWKYYSTCVSGQPNWLSKPSLQRFTSWRTIGPATILDHYYESCWQSVGRIIAQRSRFWCYAGQLQLYIPLHAKSPDSDCMLSNHSS
jgi:hypothetical protein